MSPTEVLQTVTALLDAGSSFNLYMFHGGTNFGFMNGATHQGQYQADVTSYGKSRGLWGLRSLIWIVSFQLLSGQGGCDRRSSWPCLPCCEHAGLMWVSPVCCLSMNCGSCLSFQTMTRC